MIASIIGLLPNIATGIFFILFTWFFTKMWYNSHYVHRSEVRPLQESQHVMQNQYAILAERIKNTDNQLIDTKAKLELAIREREQALLELKEIQIRNPPSSLNDYQLKTWKDELVGELKRVFAEINTLSGDDAAKFGGKEQFSFLRQSLKEFKSELSQKTNISTNQYHELSNQLWQLIELNKKLNVEAEQLNKLFSNTLSDDESQINERPFTLASIKKRS
jgi:DNA anti-recombination protein RmuC